jgi:hypothetical protein
MILANLGFLKKAKNMIYTMETIKPKKEQENKFQNWEAAKLPKQITNKTSNLENAIEDAYKFRFR